MRFCNQCGDEHGIERSRIAKLAREASILRHACPVGFLEDFDSILWSLRGLAGITETEADTAYREFKHEKARERERVAVRERERAETAALAVILGIEAWS
jgi:hypothetical protein